MENTIIEDMTPKIEAHKKKIERLTLTIEELAESLGVSKEKARQMTHIKGFPVLIVGRNRLTIKSQLENWLIKQMSETESVLE